MKKNILVLWGEPNQYIVSSLLSFDSSFNIVYYVVNDNITSYSEWRKTKIDFSKVRFWSINGLAGIIKDIRAADYIFVSGWKSLYYLFLILFAPKKAVRFLCIDTQINENFRQRVLSIIFKRFRTLFFERVFVPGYLQEIFSKSIGFKDSSIDTGLLSANKFYFSHDKRVSFENKKGFVFVGRLENEKGIELLINSYANYREEVEFPWDLNIIGEGSFRLNLSSKKNGVIYHGFLSQGEISKIMMDAAVLVAPSIYEPWGVQIHEAVSMGMYVICSKYCGSSYHLVAQGVNGCRVNLDQHSLKDALIESVSLSKKSISYETSLTLSKQFSNSNWKEVINNIEMMKKNNVF
jgi:glycosyltransferase involved in cell wall biosynthesis